MNNQKETRNETCCLIVMVELGMECFCTAQRSCIYTYTIPITTGSEQRFWRTSNEFKS